ncbi:sensor histidine kinase, partial [Sphingomonas bacterium]|uniref:sensor histidine kinase n=1 Tax=Sphingomonas bacterium TaxID=1895847 RepID=UPI001576B0FF
AIRATATRMLAEERRLLAIRNADQQRSLDAFYAVLAGAGALLLLLGVGTAVILLRFTRDLRGSRDELRGFNDTLEQQVADRTQDLTRANEEIQRFAYIVSHDLRSPLVNVMGFTAELEAATGELTRLVDRAEIEAPHLVTADARLAVREDLPEAIGFIRTSTQRMDRLINAILKLSREGRRVLAPEPLDVADIVDTAVAAMRQTIDARGAAVSVQHPMPLVVSDRTAIEQIVSNLVENATKYLQPGRAGRIAITGQRDRDRVVIAVTDNGRGIAAADHQRIFDLFRRSGAQDQPGEGIGLATVRALAYRLGGTIDVESTPGEGSVFRLSLPAQFQGSRA